MVIDINEYIINYRKFNNENIEITYNSFDNDTSKLLENLTNDKIDEVLSNTWEHIVQTIPSYYLSNNIIEFLIERKIAVDILCYKELSDEQLIKIYDKSDCVDALIILGKRILSKEEYSMIELCEFISKYNNNLLYDTLLKYMVIMFVKNEKEILYEKCFNAVNAITEQTQSKNIKDLCSETLSFFSAYKEQDIDVIESLISKENPLILLGLSLNPCSTEFILEKLLVAPACKYSKIIKNNAKERLTKSKTI